MDKSQLPIYEEFKGFGSTSAILVGLLDGRMKASDVTKYTEYRTGISKLRQFLGIGLVTLSIDEDFRHTNWYELTPKGRRVAELLAEAQKIVDEK